MLTIILLIGTAASVENVSSAYGWVFNAANDSATFQTPSGLWGGLINGSLYIQINNRSVYIRNSTALCVVPAAQLVRINRTIANAADVKQQSGVEVKRTEWETRLILEGSGYVISETKPLTDISADGQPINVAVKKRNGEWVEGKNLTLVVIK